MVAALLGGKLGIGFPGDPVAKDGCLALELARLVCGVHPVGDLGGITGLELNVSGNYKRWDGLLTAMFRVRETLLE